MSISDDKDGDESLEHIVMKQGLHNVTLLNNTNLGHLQPRNV